MVIKLKGWVASPIFSSNKTRFFRLFTSDASMECVYSNELTRLSKCDILSPCSDVLSLFLDTFKVKARVYNKEGGRVSYSSIVPGTAVVRVQTRSMIFTTCGMSLWAGAQPTL